MVEHNAHQIPSWGHLPERIHDAWCLRSVRFVDADFFASILQSTDPDYVLAQNLYSVDVSAIKLALKKLDRFIQRYKRSEET